MLCGVKYNYIVVIFYLLDEYKLVFDKVVVKNMRKEMFFFGWNVILIFYEYFFVNCFFGDVGCRYII